MKNALKNFRYFQYIKPYIKFEIMIFILILLSSVVALMNPILLKTIIDKVIIMKQIYLLKYIIALLFFFFIFNMLILFCNGYLNMHIGQEISIKLRTDLFRHIQQLKLESLQENYAGDFINKINSDVAVISTFLTETLISISNDIFNVLATAVLMCFFSWKLAVIAFIIMCIQLVVSGKFSAKTRACEREVKETASRHVSFVKQVFTGLKFVKAFVQQLQNEKNYSSLLNRILNLNFKRFYILYWHNAAVTLISFFGSVAIFVLGVLQIYQGEMSVGTLFVFDSVFERFYQFANNIVNLNVNLQGIFVSVERIDSIFNLEKEDYESGKKLPAAASINFDNVVFQYKKDEKMVLDGFSINFKPGETYALVGESGNGKTTIINLLLRLYTVNDGKITINNENINDIGLNTLRQKIAVIFQEGFISDGTIEENLRMGNENREWSEIERICKLCCVNEFIDNFPGGYRTFIGEGGVKLSGGQVQRLCLARSLLRAADIFIFDESFSHLDKNLEEKIFRNIRGLLQGKTQLFITHNIRLIKDIRFIYVLNRGKIESHGNHSQLMESSPTYRMLLAKDTE